MNHHENGLRTTDSGHGWGYTFGSPPYSFRLLVAVGRASVHRAKKKAPRWTAAPCSRRPARPYYKPLMVAPLLGRSPSPEEIDRAQSAAMSSA